MSEHDPSRRSVLRLCVQWPVIGVTACMLSACGRKIAVCADPHNLTASENALRQGAHYVEHSTQPDKTCSKCSFFAEASAAACGVCQIFQGPVNRSGHCDSFSAKT